MPARSPSTTRGTIMAYRSWTFHSEDGAGAPLSIVTLTAPISDIAPVDASDFSPLEWSVVQLARKDGMATLRAPGRWAKLHRLIFGERSDPRLADERLEALRHVAVEAWHRGYALHPARIAAFLSAGFTYAHLERLLADVTAIRGAPKTRSFA